MSWDDGAHAKVKKVQITYDEIIYSIQVTYDGSNLQSQLRGSIGPKSAEFTLDSDEYITSLNAYSKTLGSQEAITFLAFTTNKRTYGPFGNKSGFQISAPEATGKQIAGFLGSSSNILNDIDVHYAPVPTGNMSWDDGAHAKVKKVQITYDEIIYSIQVTYDGSNLQSQLHGSIGPKSAEFTLDSDEYITSLNAYGKTLGSQEAITSLAFTTNKRTYGPFGNKSGFQISAPEATGKQIAGFLGSSSNILNDIDVHYAPVPTGTGGGTGGSPGGTGGGSGGSPGTTTPSDPPKKLKAEGGEGTVWDDGSHDNVKKVYVGQDGNGVSAVKFEYKNGSQVVLGVVRGKSSYLGYDEFELESDDYITSVEGTYDKIYGYASGIMTMLVFKTSKNKTGGPYGIEGSTRFVLKEEGYKIVGFHGRAGENINAIGAYLAPIGTIPIIPATPGQKLEGYGSGGGTSWDDGAYDGVKKVFVGQGLSGISVVKFVYNKGAQVVIGDEHGEPSMLVEEFEIDYPSEYITAVEGTYDKIYGSDGTVINMLRFKTNKKPSIRFGIEAGTPFVCKKEGHKIVGFHGKVGEVLHQFGVHVLPVTN